MKLYDKENQRLIYIDKEANASFWDEHWNKLINTIEYKKGVPKLNTAVYLTRRYLEKGSTILEGGCGLAMTSWYLKQLGYKTISLDYADKTINFLSEKIPEVNPIKGDVRNTSLDNSSIDGYWSFGVIEHFWDGYDDIIIEAKRIIKKDGYFFVTFPQFSLLRRVKASLGFYKSFNQYNSQTGFYQFALYPLNVKKNIEKYDFQLVQSLSIGGMKGLKDEVLFLEPILQVVYDSRNTLVVIFRKFIDITFSWVSGHTKVLVFKRL